jgi:hypothetical protein
MDRGEHRLRRDPLGRTDQKPRRERADTRLVLEPVFRNDPRELDSLKADAHLGIVLAAASAAWMFAMYVWAFWDWNADRGRKPPEEWAPVM